MKKILINELGYALGPYSLDANIELEVSDDIADKVYRGTNGKVWKYDESKNDFDLIDYLGNDYLREKRESECFSYINRGGLWYDTLTDTQKAELRSWYLAWLDVTETKIIPEKPSWLD